MASTDRSVNWRAVRDEEPWIPDTLDDVADVISLLDTRFEWHEMYGIVDWLVRKTMGWPDPTSSATRSRYRRMLREVGLGLEPVTLERVQPPPRSRVGSGS